MSHQHIVVGGNTVTIHGRDEVAVAHLARLFYLAPDLLSATQNAIRLKGSPTSLAILQHAINSIAPHYRLGVSESEGGEL